MDDDWGYPYFRKNFTSQLVTGCHLGHHIGPPENMLPHESWIVIIFLKQHIAISGYTKNFAAHPNYHFFAIISLYISISPLYIYIHCTLMKCVIFHDFSAWWFPSSYPQPIIWSVGYSTKSPYSTLGCWSTQVNPLHWRPSLAWHVYIYIYNYIILYYIISYHIILYYITLY